MIDTANREKLEQKKMDAQCSVVANRAYIARIEKFLTIVDVLAICTPIGFLSVQLALIPYEAITKALSIINPILSAALLILAIISLIKGSRNKLKQHQRFLVENLPIIEEIDQLLNDEDADIKDAKRIVEKTTNLDKEEWQLLPGMNESEKQGFYREALKLSGNPDVVCPICYKSPWKYKKSENSCQQCGNSLNDKEDNTK